MFQDNKLDVITNGKKTQGGALGITSEIDKPEGFGEAVSIDVNSPDRSTLELSDNSIPDASNKGLVATQMNSLLDGDSQYVKRAQDISMQQSNSRGLINSTMAAQAGTAAAIDSALPIARQDAQTISNQNMQERDYQNSNNQLSYQTEANMSLANADRASNVSQFNTAQFNDYINKEKQRANDLSINMAGIQSETTSKMFESYMDGLVDLQTNDFGKGNPNAKASAIADWVNEYDAAMLSAEKITGAIGMWSGQ